MSKAGKMIKGMLKAKKESVMGKLANGDDPMEPWSKRFDAPIKEDEQLDESDPVLFKYIRSLGWEPKHMDFATRSKYARSNAFKNFKVGHTADPKERMEESENLDEAGTGLLMSYIKAKGLDPRLMDGNQKASYSKSSEFQKFKSRHVKEVSGMGERGDDWNEEKKPKAKKVQEAVDEKDTVTMDIPLLIRVLEYAREDAKTDMDLHKVVENLINMRGQGALSMDMYNKIVAIKEEIEKIDELSKGTLTSYATKARADASNLSKQGDAASKRSSMKSMQTALDKFRKATKRHIGAASAESKARIKEAYGPAATAALQNKNPAYHVAAMDRKDKENKLNVDRDRALARQKVSRGEDPTLTHAGNAALKAQQRQRMNNEGVVDEASWVNGVKQDPESKVWKLTSMSHADAVAKHGKENVRHVDAVNRSGDKTGRKHVEVLSKLGEEVEQIDELKKQSDTQELDSVIAREDLRKWFSKTDPEGGWKRINSKGEAIGPCAREPGEPKPKCMSNEKRAQLSKKERAAAVAAKRKHDPVADRSSKGGKPVNVSNFGKGKLGEERLEEKNSPTNSKLWARAKAMARSKFDVYPSAYANGWASKWYKSKGGGWKSVKEDGVQEGSTGWHPSSTVKNPNFNDELSIRRISPPGKRLKSGKLSADERGSQERTKALMKYTQKRGGLTGPKGALPEEAELQEGIYGIEDSPLSATNSVKAMESAGRRKKEMSKSARMIKAIYKKKNVKETMYDWEKSEKGAKPTDEPTAKVIMKGGTTMTGKPRDTVEIGPVLRTKLNSPAGNKPSV
jgi:hypothetical protein